jgi:hypothetical protein
MGSTHKKVVVRKMTRDSIAGYVTHADFIADGNLELLNTAGNLVRIHLAEVKCVYFVRDFNESESSTRKTFTSRPRTEGLWVRLKYKDGDIMEGLMANDLTQITPEGFLLNPPDTRGNTQRLFVPRAALAALTVLAVIGGMQGRRRPLSEEEKQVGLFGE